jgi:hypothetical protein
MLSVILIIWLGVIVGKQIYDCGYADCWQGISSTMKNMPYAAVAPTFISIIHEKIMVFYPS